ncbi:MAG: insulinase family protein [Deltaproteobacteria bacterium]|nr:insulinase family protein [Deltaproteobacteria bacterium]
MRRSRSWLVLTVVATSACGGAPRVVRPAPTFVDFEHAGNALAERQSAMKAPVLPPLIRELGGIREYRLANGLQVLLFPDPSQANVTVNITYRVGSRLEGYGETGMAHLLEHMTFKGPPGHRNILKLVDERGGSANGTTWTDRTNYFETLEGTPANLAWAIGLEADRMVNCAIDPADLASEFSVVRNELEEGENDSTRLLDSRLMAAAYLWHNYGKDTIGARSDIERVPAERLRAFYQRYYQPDNATLVVAGQLDVERTLAEITRTFGAIPRPTRVLDDAYTIEPVQDGERAITLRRNGAAYVVGVLYHTVGGASPDHTAVNAALDVLTREPSGLLYQQLVKPGLAASVTGYAYDFADPSVAMIMAEVRDGKDADRVRDTIVRTVERLGGTRIDDRAVARWRNALLSAFDHQLADSSEVAIALTDAVALGDWRLFFAQRQQIAATTAADVQRVAAAYFRRDNRTVGMVVPTPRPARAPAPPTPDVAAIAAAATAASAAAGEPFTATVDAIEARTVRKELPGGIRAALLAKRTRGGRVVVDLALHWGDATSLAKRAVIGELAAQLMARGTRKHDLQALADREDELRAQISIDGAADGVTIHAVTFREQLPQVLALVAEQLTTPSFPADELEVVRQERLAALEAEALDPPAQAWRETRRRVEGWPKGDPRRPLTVEEELAEVGRVRRSDIEAFWREVAGAGHGELAVVGDFDPAALDALAPLATWTSKARYERLAAKRFPVTGGTTTIDIRDKEMAQLRVALPVAIQDTSADYPAWLVLGRVFGEGSGSRVWMRLREREGLSYGAGGRTWADSLDEVGGLTGQAIVAPVNLAKARASMIAEVETLAGGVVTAAELAAAKEAWTRELATDLASDDYLASAFVEDLFLGRTLAWRRELDARIQAVTTDELATVAHALLKPADLIVVQAGDMAKAAP